MNWQKLFKCCPKCGSGNVYFRHEKSLLCRDCEFVYYHNVAAAVAGIIEHEGKIIIARRGREPMKDMLDLPGGFIDYRETAEQALIREIKEELNIDICDLSYIGSAPNIYIYGGITYQVLDTCFRCKPEAIDTIKADDDVAGFDFVDPMEIDINDFAFESTKSFILKYQACYEENHRHHKS